MPWSRESGSIPVGILRKVEHIRCPYCVDAGNFKIMTLQSGGDWYLCGSCGHLALPSNPLFHCTCGKCVGLETRKRDAVGRRGFVDNVQEGLSKILGRSDPRGRG